MDARGAGKAQSRLRTIARPIARKLWTINLEGFDRLPESGPAILAPNHISFLDSAFLMLSVSRNISFVGKAEYMDSWKTKFLFPALGMIPIDRGGGKKSMIALETAEEVLRRGELFGIFPEGTRSRDGYLYKGRTGVARLALRLGCPIFPVGVVGTDQIQPPDARMPKLRRECTIAVGRPIKMDRYLSRAGDRLVLRQITDELMYEIRELTGQEYRNVYSGKTADTEPTVKAKVATVGEKDASLTEFEVGELAGAVAAVAG
ncbi:MAG: lysophospholipid acyltransferase family protein [Ilumatobacteraceae bacterium]